LGYTVFIVAVADDVDDDDDDDDHSIVSYELSPCQEIPHLYGT
jgi:hypothetical protein